MKRREIEQLLPVVFQRTLRADDALTAILEAMEALHAPSEEVLQQLERFFHPYRSPDHFVPYLASWVDLDRLFTDSLQNAEVAVPPLATGMGRLRELIAAAAFLSKWRGTTKGLQRFLETATGVNGFLIEEQVSDNDGLPRPFHIAIRAPTETQPFQDLIERIISMEKPAYVTYELHFNDAKAPED